MEKALKKTITWRCVALVTVGVVGYAFTGSVTVGASLSIAINVINSVLYYLHEKFWEAKSGERKKGRSGKGPSRESETRRAQSGKFVKDS